MDLHSIVAASGNGGGDFLVGILVGCVIGVLVGPAFRSWQAYREWSDASREARLADRLLERLEVDADLDERNFFTDTEATDPGAAWRTRP
jgi:hypothetical protein